MAPYKVTIKTRKVGQFTLDGKLVKTYNTVRECRKEFESVSPHGVEKADLSLVKFRVQLLEPRLLTGAIME